MASQSSPILLQHSSPPPVRSIDITTDTSGNPTMATQLELDAASGDSATEQLLVTRPSQEQIQLAASAVLQEDQADTPMIDLPGSFPDILPTDNNLLEGVENVVANQQLSDELAAQVNVAEGMSDPPSQDPDMSAETAPITDPTESPTESSRRKIPEWVTWNDDLTSPDDEELKEIEESGIETSAVDVPAIEKRVFQEVDDPEQRPIKKIRLSWVVKGVRGTRERPNFARTINSPCALVDGHYWQIKLYPRGNKCSAVSAYIRCTKRPPKSDSSNTDGTFCYFEGPPDANIGEGAEAKHVSPCEPKSASNASNVINEASLHKLGDTDVPLGLSDPTASQNNDVEMRGDEPVRTTVGTTVEDDFRISAQLGMVIYNPAEPRTCTVMSSDHQFCNSNDDWGWTNFVGPWDRIHVRQRGQRQALLRDDTIAIDAYIRIFEDPTQALWWHESNDHEKYWPSKKLAGYFPMGTPRLYHSPAVAGITSLLLLAPFRRIIEMIDAGKWRTSSQVKPQPIICLLQIVLHLMRDLKSGEYVNVHYVIEALRDFGETYCDVKSFWEAFRRSLELELEHEADALCQLSRIFDAVEGKFTIPTLPVQGISDVQQGLDAVFSDQPTPGLAPDFLPLNLQRESFDKIAREWKLHHDRVILNEEIEWPNSKAGQDATRYTLYGFMVQVDDRQSGKFYSVLRPNGPGTKWLAFEDGDGNKVHSYTKRKVQEFEGLERDDLKNFKSTRQTAYMVMYLKTSCLKNYLPGQMDPYELPEWIKPYVHLDLDIKQEEQQVKPNVEHDIDVEIYHDEAVVGRKGLLDMFNVRDQSMTGKNFRSWKLSPKTTFQEIRQRVADDMEVDDVKSIRMFTISYGFVGQYTSAQWEPIVLQQSIDLKAAPVGPLCLWTSLLKSETEIEAFGVADPPIATLNEILAVDALIAQDRPVPVDLDVDTIDSTSRAEANNPSSGMEASAETGQSSVHDAVTIELQHDATITGTDQQPSVTSITQDAPVEDNTNTMVVPPTEPRPTEERVLDDVAVPEDTGVTRALDAAEIEVINNTIALIGNREVTQTQPDTAGDDDAMIASLIAADAMAMDIAQDSFPGEQSGQAIETPSEDQSVLKQPPAQSVYGFLQFFDAHQQNFIVRTTFFAKRDDAVKDFVRKLLGYDEDKEFYAWHRETDLDGSSIDTKATFSDIHFADGVDLIIGDVLQESTIEELRRHGKFHCPFKLTRFLRMLQRRHPIYSKTTTEPVVVADFGNEYYKGPLVNGQAHGDNCFQITTNGHTYEGPLVSGEKCGNLGRMMYQNGDTYEGEWLRDERHGQGVFIEKRTGNKYVGGFENGKRWGKGTTFWQVADQEADMCQICYGEEIDALFFDCGHVCACVECARQCVVCPICRKNVRQVVKMYWA